MNEITAILPQPQPGVRGASDAAGGTGRAGRDRSSDFSGELKRAGERQADTTTRARKDEPKPAEELVAYASAQTTYSARAADDGGHNESVQSVTETAQTASVTAPDADIQTEIAGTQGDQGFEQILTELDPNPDLDDAVAAAPGDSDSADVLTETAAVEDGAGADQSAAAAQAGDGHSRARHADSAGRNRQPADVAPIAEETPAVDLSDDDVDAIKPPSDAGQTADTGTAREETETERNPVADENAAAKAAEGERQARRGNRNERQDRHGAHTHHRVERDAAQNAQNNNNNATAVKPPDVPAPTVPVTPGTPVEEEPPVNPVSPGTVVEKPVYTAPVYQAEQVSQTAPVNSTPVYKPPAEGKETYTNPFAYLGIADSKVMGYDPVTRTMPYQIVSQIVDAIRVAIAEGRTAMQITLNPEALGELQILLVHDADGLTARIRVPDDRVDNMLNVGLHDLASTLKEMGVNVKNIEITQADLGWDFTRDLGGMNDGGESKERAYQSGGGRGHQPSRHHIEGADIFGALQTQDLRYLSSMFYGGLKATGTSVEFNA